MRNDTQKILGSLNKTQPLGLLRNGEGHFSVRYFAVTVLLWVGIAAVTASCWFSAWSLGVAFTRWMGS